MDGVSAEKSNHPVFLPQKYQRKTLFKKNIIKSKAWK